MTKNEAVLSFLSNNYPDAKCSLDFSSPFQCLVAVMLSAQTTDKAVNQVTPSLFSSFPDAFSMAQADVSEIEEKIKTLGLYHNKAKNLSDLANTLVNQYEADLPKEKEDVLSLPGVGIKTCNVVLSETRNVPAIAVDRHVARIAYRLGYAKKDNEPSKIEAKLEKQFPKEEWINLHHRLIAFGRDVCHSQNPECGRCLLHEYCSYFKKSSLTKGK